VPPPQHRIALLACKTPYNAIWASCARVKFFLLRLRRMKFFRGKFIVFGILKFHPWPPSQFIRREIIKAAKPIVKLPLDRKLN